MKHREVEERQIINQPLENQVTGNIGRRENQDKASSVKQATPRKREKKKPHLKSCNLKARQCIQVNNSDITTINVNLKGKNLLPVYLLGIFNIHIQLSNKNII